MFIFAERPKEIPTIDLGIAITATGPQADQMFQKMKDTLKAIVDRYGSEKIHYAAIVFGDTINRKLSFNERFSNPEDVKTFISVMPRLGRGPDLSKALEEGKKLFSSGEGVRPDSKQVFLVITDQKSTSSPAEVKTAAKALTDANVHVIAVGIGSDVDPQELRTTTPNAKDVITVPEQETPEALAQKIMNTAREGG